MSSAVNNKSLKPSSPTDNPKASKPPPPLPPPPSDPPPNGHHHTVSSTAAAAALAINMSTGKRLAKRSILGTRVVAPGEDGRFYSGIIQAVKTCEESNGGDVDASSSSAANSGSDGENRYSVRFEATRTVKEFRESEIVGPGFASVTSSKLRAGQIVYVTHCNREVQGSVLHHRPNLDQVIIQILNGGPEVKKKLEEVRLLESRKSARLSGIANATDFSKLADFNIVSERKRLNSETNSSDTSGRKRRGSETFSDSSDEHPSSGVGDHGQLLAAGTSLLTSPSAMTTTMELELEEMADEMSTAEHTDLAAEVTVGECSSSPTPSSPAVMTECTAAMVLMKLYSSPAKQRQQQIQKQQQQQKDKGAISDPHQRRQQQQPSPTNSSSSSASSSSLSSSPLNMTMSAAQQQQQPQQPQQQQVGLDLTVAANVSVGPNPGSVSPSQSSGVSSLGSSWSTTSGSTVSSSPPGSMAHNMSEAEALLQLSNQESDEGIVSDQSSSADPEDAAKRNKTESSSSSSPSSSSPPSSSSSSSLLQLRVIYQCTWPGCRVQCDECADMERHVRRRHLMRADPISEEDNDHEEEFYYTEIEIPHTVAPAAFGKQYNGKQQKQQHLLQQQQPQRLQYGGKRQSPSLLVRQHSNPQQQHHQTLTVAHVATPPSPTTLHLPPPTHVAAMPPLPILADHMDMARPPHENPEYYRVVSISTGGGATARNGVSNGNNTPNGGGVRLASAVPIAIPMTGGFNFAQQQQQQRQAAASPSSPSSAPTTAGGGKYIRLSPKPFGSASNGASSSSSSSQGANAAGKSPVRRPRGDAKKCRKVYGMEHREMWCTQCKWKKACTRFGEGT